MAITPLDIRKMTFPQKLRGYDPQEVENFLELVAEELTSRLGDVARFEQENREFRRHLAEAHARQAELQETMLQAQRLSAEITTNAKREGSLLIKEAEVAADTMVSQAIERANKLEAKILQLRTQRRELHLKVKNALDHYQRILDEDVEDEMTSAIIRTLPRRQQAS